MFVLSGLSALVAVCFLIVMFGNPFKDKLDLFLTNYLGNNNKRGIRVKLFNDHNVYFYEQPFGVSGVIYENEIYLFDKFLNVTNCAPPTLYGPVFHISKESSAGKGRFLSKCFLSEEVIRGVFANASLEYIVQIPTTANNYLLQSSSFSKRAKEIVSLVTKTMQ